MTTTRNKSLTTIIILLIVMALLSGISLATNRISVGRTRQPGTFTNGGNAQGNGNFQGGGGDAQGNGTGQGNSNFQGNGNFQRNSGFNLFSIFRTLGLGGQVMGYITLGFGILGIMFLLLSVYGVWMQKKWGLNLAMVMAVIFLLGALPGLFSLNISARFFNINVVLRFVETIVNAGASIVILFMGILPSVRDSVS
jgi:hypothetical protein